MRTQRFPMMLTRKERRMLQLLANHEGLSAAAVLRQLLRKEAAQAGIWQERETAAPQLKLVQPDDQSLEEATDEYP